MVYFVGAGPGDAELITVKGQKLIQNADVIIYAGSLVNEELLLQKKKNCAVYNSAFMTLEEVIDTIQKAEENFSECCIVRLHTGDPSLYGAIREQMDELEKLKIKFEVVPGVSSFSAAAAALNVEYTLPAVSQTLIITRASGKTKVPESESIKSLAAHNCSLVLFLSASLCQKVQDELLLSGISPKTPASIVYKASWREQKIFSCTVETLSKTAQENGICKTALILVGDFLQHSDYEKSKLYDSDFSTEFRKA